jgi:hypothetical protein
VRRGDRDALTVWVASRAGVAVLTWAAMWLVVDAPAGRVAPWLGSWQRWDADLYVKVARFGYLGFPRHYSDRGIVAFFPGEPLALRAVHAVVRNWAGAGLLVSAVAGAVACVALARIGALEGETATGTRAALFLVLSPMAVFLAAGYSESLFLAFALPSWLAARRGRWGWASALAAVSVLVRVTGVFLALALLTQWLVGASRRWRDLPLLLAPLLVTAGYIVYLHHLTGDWMAWPHAQQEEWGRSLTAPWTAWSTTWRSAFGGGQAPAYAWSFRAEMVSVVIGVVLTVVLLARRRWAETVYVGGQVAALATSSFYLSVARATLLWWPLWVLLAGAAAHRRWVQHAYVAVAPALMAVGVVAFVQGHWVG